MEIKYRELHRVVVTAIIVKENKFLITQRSPSKKAFPNMWTVPGGGLEVDDYIATPQTTPNNWYFAIEKTLQREVKEEVNLDIGRINYLLDIAFVRQDGVPVVILSFYCNYKSGEVKLNKENIDYKWVSFEQAKDYDLVPGLLGELQMVDRILRGENLADIRYANI